MATSQNTSLQVVAPREVEASAPVDYSREQIELIKDTYAKGATDGELRLFLEVAKRKGLDIFSKQICLIPRWDAKLGREVKDPQTTIDGYRLIAERTDRYVPGRDTTYEYNDTGKLHSATAYIKKLVAGEWHEIAATAFFEEYKQTKKDGTLNATWQKMPHVMIAKCAESLALRRAFPAELSGIYTAEEMGSATIDVTPEPSQPERTIEQIASELVAHTSKVNGAYEVVDDGGEIFTVSKGATGSVCSCGSEGAPLCRHRLAASYWANAQKPTPVEAETEPVEPFNQPPIDPHSPAKLSRSQLISICEATTKLETLGVDTDSWRDLIENLVGVRSRKEIPADEFKSVWEALNAAVVEIERKRSKKR